MNRMNKDYLSSGSYPVLTRPGILKVGEGSESFYPRTFLCTPFPIISAVYVHFQEMAIK